MTGGNSWRATLDVAPALSPDDRWLASLTSQRFAFTTIGRGKAALTLVEVAPRIAAPDGVANGYRLNLARGEFARVTDLATGVSGITAGSPALSYARQVDRLAFSVLRGGGYDIHVVDAPGRVADTATGARLGVPRSRVFGGDPQAVTTLNLPGTANVRAAPIDVSAIAPYGTHNLGAYVSANGGVRDCGGQVLYLNRAVRWNWDATAMLLPCASGAIARSIEQQADFRAWWCATRKRSSARPISNCAGWWPIPSVAPSSSNSRPARDGSASAVNSRPGSTTPERESCWTMVGINSRRRAP